MLHASRVTNEDPKPMLDRRLSRRLIALALSLSIISAAAFAGSEFMAEPSWQPPSVEAIHTQLEAFLQSSQLSPSRQAEARDQWAATKNADAAMGVLDRLAQ